MRAPAAPLRILVVDDDPDVLELIQLVLIHFGHLPTALADPTAAVAALEAGIAADLVLTDQTMPGMTGTRLAQLIRRRWPDVGIGLITGTVAVAQDAPADLFDMVLEKPLDMAALRKELDRFAMARTFG